MIIIIGDFLYKHEFVRSVGAQALRGVPRIEHEGRSARERQRERSGNGQWFDLQGRRVDNTSTGLYIQDGLKVIIK